MKMLSNYVAIRENREVARTTPGGLALPARLGTSAPHFKTGVVVAVGPGLWSETSKSFLPPEVKKGDEVGFFVDNIREVEVTGETLVVVREANIFASL